MNKKISGWLQKNTPPGTEVRKELREGLSIVTVVILLFFFLFLIAYMNARTALFETDVYGRITSQIKPGAQMPALSYFLHGKLSGIILISVYSIIKACIYYRSFFTESKSIYLMKRIPDRYEIWKRSLSLPAGILFAGVLLSAVLLGACTAVYYLGTPEICIPAFRGLGLLGAFDPVFFAR